MHPLAKTFRENTDKKNIDHGLLCSRRYVEHSVWGFRESEFLPVSAADVFSLGLLFEEG